MAPSSTPDFSHLTTFEVLQRLFEGDPDVAGWVWNKYKASVTQGIRRNIGERFRTLISAEDCLTDAWIEFMKDLQKKGPTAYASDSDLGALIYTISYRKLLRMIREKEAWETLGSTEREGEPEEETDWRNFREQALDVLWRELDDFKLSDEQRTYVRLRFYDASGKIPTNEELATEMNRLFPRRNPPFTAENLRKWYQDTILSRLRNELLRRLRGR